MVTRSPGPDSRAHTVSVMLAASPHRSPVRSPPRSPPRSPRTPMGMVKSAPAPPGTLDNVAKRKVALGILLALQLAKLASWWSLPSAGAGEMAGGASATSIDGSMMGDATISAAAAAAANAASAEDANGVYMSPLLLWMLLDIVYFVVLARMQIDKLAITPQRTVGLLIAFAVFNDFLFGGTFGRVLTLQSPIQAHAPGHVSVQSSPSGAGIGGIGIGIGIGQGLVVGGGISSGQPSSSNLSPALQSSGAHQRPAAFIETTEDLDFDGSFAKESKERVLHTVHTDLPFPGLVSLHLIVKPKARFRSHSPVSLGAHIPLQVQCMTPCTLQYRISPLSYKALHSPEFPATRTDVTLTKVLTSNYGQFVLAESTGHYSLVGLRDARDQPGMIGNDTITVLIGPAVLQPLPERAPTARFVRKDGDLHGCAGDHFETTLRLTGIAPFSVLLDFQLNRGPSSRVALIVTEAHRTPHYSGQQYSINLGTLETTTDGQMSWQIVSVTDGRNLTRTYVDNIFSDEPVSQQAKSPVSSSTPSAKASSLHKTRLVVIVHQLPTVSFKDEHTLLLPGKFTLAPLSVQTKAWPVRVVLILSPDETTVALHFAGPNDAHVNVTNIGNYHLYSLHDAYCAGVVGQPSILKVTQPPLPKLAVNTTALPTQVCLGSDVVMVPLNVTGAGPWTVMYRERVAETGAVSLHQFSFASANYQWMLVPLTVGKSTYEFISISDRHYSAISVYDLVFNLTVIQPPSIQFKKREPLRLCSTTSTLSAEIPLVLEGHAPFSLAYSLRLGEDHREFLLEGLTAPAAVIQLDGLGARGHYRLSLDRITDAAKCETELDLQKTLVIDRLSAQLSCIPDQNQNQNQNQNQQQQQQQHSKQQQQSSSSGVWLAGANSFLSVHLSGGVAPYTVQYRAPGSSSVQQVVTGSTVARIPITGSGVYQVVSASDDSCPGDIAKEHSECIINVVDRPHLTVHPDLSICYSPKVRLGSLDFSGTAPWRVNYNVAPLDSLPHHLSTAASSSSNTVTTRIDETPQFDFKPEFNQALNQSLLFAPPHAGRFHVRIATLSDLHYAALALPASSQYAFNVDIVPLASVNFEPLALEEHSICVGQTLRLPIVLQGTGPFVVHYNVVSEAGSVAYTARYEGEKPKSFFAAALSTSSEPQNISTVLELGPFDHEGTFSVQLTAVTDATLCFNRMTKDIRSGVIVVGAVPFIHASSARAVFICVGERIKLEFGPSNAGPWTMHYLFNGESRSHVVTHSPFTLQTRTEGVMNIQTVSNRFCSAPVSFVQPIRSLPSASLDRGQIVEDDLSEGDTKNILISLLGTAPFNVTIQRTSFFEDEPQMLELRGIRNSEYNMQVQQEGQYRIVYVADKFCQSFHDPRRDLDTSIAGPAV